MIKTKVIRQSDLQAAHCWMVQIWGLVSCKSCPVKDTSECGGREILKQMRAGRYSITGMPEINQPKKRR